MALKISIGADPELFLKKDGRFISAHDILPGTKHEPHAVDKGAVQVDGVAAEFNILPAYTAREFSSYNAQVMKQLRDMAPGCELVLDPVAVFEESYFHKLPDNVRELGCNPDFNAYTGQVNKKPDSTGCMRTAAGHIHIGWGKDFDPSDPIHFEDCRVVARQMDFYLGAYSLQWDNDDRRRKMYGAAGSFRPKPYGVEYRPLSNTWLKSARLQEWIFNAAYQGVHRLINDGQCLEDKLGDVARKVIDGNEAWWTDRKHKLYGLNQYTGLMNPPAIEVCPPIIKMDDKPSPIKRKAKHMYGETVNGLTTFDTGITAGAWQTLNSNQLVNPTQS